MRWKDWVNQLEFAEKALHEKKSYGNHIGGNGYCTDAENNVCMDIRQYTHQKGDLSKTIRICSLDRTVTRDNKRFTRTERVGTLLPTEWS